MKDFNPYTAGKRNPRALARAASSEPVKHSRAQIKYTLCYQVVTPESAEHGDFSEHGFMDEHGNRFALQDEDGHHPDTLKDNHELTADGIGDLIAVAERFGIEYLGDADWAHSHGEDIDYTTGATTEYSLHVKHERHHYHVMKALDRQTVSRPNTKRTPPPVEAMKGETPADYPQDYNSAAQDLMDPW